MFLKGNREPVDKIYFRKKDETSEYAEFLFRSKVSYKSLTVCFQCVVGTYEKMKFTLIIFIQALFKI
jgi:hypothetical protein